jgi:aryl-alcohol dehydrogenase-like predicted oxidoreductase
MPITGKLVLGTAQFGFNYGITNTIGKTPENEMTTIFNLAKNNNINFLDTAAGYGDSEVNIGKHAGSQFEIISKFPLLENSNELTQLLNTTLQRVRLSSVYGYMAHNADILIKKPELWDALLELKNQKVVKKIGFSLYNTLELDKLLSLGILPDIIQIPYSILDRQFESRLQELKNLNVEIHARSVFLQGLYFMKPSELPPNLKGLMLPLSQLSSLCKEYKVSVAELALNYVIDVPFIDKVVIGVNTKDQLEENIKLINNYKKNELLINAIENIRVEYASLLNPATWN